MRFFRRKTNVKKYKFEPTSVQLRIIRTHIAAQASQLSTIETRLGQLGQALDRIEAKAEGAQ